MVGEFPSETFTCLNPVGTEDVGDFRGDRLPCRLHTVRLAYGPDVVTPQLDDKTRQPKEENTGGVTVSERKHTKNTQGSFAELP